MKLHFTNDWLKKHIEADPDGDVEAGSTVDPTTLGDAVADEVRRWYEANRETWWERQRRRYPCGLADEFILALINEVHRVEAALSASPARPGGVGVERPDWKHVYNGLCHTADQDDELIPVTRETLRLARNALRKMNEDDYYHNNGAAEREIIDALDTPAPYCED